MGDEGLLLQHSRCSSVLLSKGFGVSSRGSEGLWVVRHHAFRVRVQGLLLRNERHRQTSMLLSRTKASTTLYIVHFPPPDSLLWIRSIHHLVRQQKRQISWQSCCQQWISATSSVPSSLHQTCCWRGSQLKTVGEHHLEIHHTSTMWRVSRSAS